VDLLQLLILLTITGICGAFAVLILGFSPRGMMTLVFSVIVGTIGAALGNWVDVRTNLFDTFIVKVGTIQINIVLSVIGSIAVVGILLGLQWLVSLQDRAPAPKPAADANSPES
jgi:uncharacterized membrane protein YeaQ/YmgE (transglycosylase-associated protein family)